MDEKSSLVRLDTAGMASKEMLTTMRHLERREWWLWSSAIAVTILLLGIASFFFDSAARGLLGLVLLFNLYVVYEQIQIRRIRREFANQLYTLSVIDPLTSLFNRRYVEHRLEGEIARCQRQGTQLTLILFDLDGFKQVNDEHGHAVGDDALKMFAERLRMATRGSDVVARYGGDEFLALLPDCKSDGVHHLLNRLNEIQITTSESRLPVAFSAGWANYRIGDSVAEFLKRADAALYVNKRRAKGTTATLPDSE